MTSERDNFKAGLFVLAGIVLALVTVFALSDFRRFFERTQSVSVSFKLADGLRGLKEGATVTLGDQPVGTVLVIDDLVDNEDQETVRVTGKRVTFQIPKRYGLHKDAVIELKPKLIGSGTTLNIRSVGVGDPYEPGSVLEGNIFPSELAANLVSELGITDLERQRIRNIVANVDSIMTNLKDRVPEMTQSVSEVLEQVKPLAADARQAVADAKEAVAEAREMVGQIHERSGLWMDRVDSITESADGSLARVDQLLADKDQALRNTVDHVEAVTQRVRQETMEQVKAALEKADAALANARDATDEIKSFLISQRPVLEHTMANFALTAAQLKLTAIEVRRSPWRLLYKPDEKELESDNLYDAARSFALAAGTLDVAAASLRSIVENEPDNHEQVQKMVDYLDKLFDRFQGAEQAFWKALDGQAPAP